MTPTRNRRNKVFLCYAHRAEADVYFKGRLALHLRALEAGGVTACSVDDEPAPGADPREIEHALAASQAAVLLVSPDFLASPFIRSRALSAIFEAAETRGLQIFPVLVSPCAMQEELARLRFVNPALANGGLQAMTDLAPAAADQVFEELTAAVREVFERTGAAMPDQPVRRSMTPPATTPPWSVPRYVEDERSVPRPVRDARGGSPLRVAALTASATVALVAGVGALVWYLGGFHHDREKQVDQLVRECDEALRQQDFALALLRCGEASRQSPHEESVRSRLARAEEGLKRWGVERQVGLLALEADRALTAENWALAVEKCTQALALDPHSEPLAEKKARAQAEEKLRAAYERYDQATKLGQHEAAMAALRELPRGSAYREKAERSSAEARKGYMAAGLTRATALLGEMKCEEARTLVEQLLEVEPGNKAALEVLVRTMTEGVLDVSTRPPAFISIDGKRREGKTPQKLLLKIGAHRLTLTDPEDSDNASTASVEIEACKVKTHARNLTGE